MSLLGIQSLQRRLPRAAQLFMFAAFLGFPALAFAGASDWVQSDIAAARLLSGTKGVGAEEVVSLGLEVKLEPGWHTYWRSPGQAGLPPQLDWSRSETDDGNLQSVRVSFPAPRRSAAYGLETIGYSENVLFPIDVILRHPGKALKADVGVDLLLCLSTCVPQHFDLALTVPEGSAEPSAEADLLAAARERLPLSSEDAGILLRAIENDGQSLAFKIFSREPIAAPDIFVENAKNINFGAPEIVPEGDDHSATLTLRPVDNLPASETLSQIPLVLTIVNGDQAAEIQAESPVARLAPSPAEPRGLGFMAAFLFALVGGLVLNFMPCVLPVLSLKIFSVVSHGGGERGRVRQSFLMTAAGIFFSFLVLAGVLVLLKRLEMEVGWGLQFQQPAFLMFLVLLLTFFASNMWGLFDIQLPGVVADQLEPTYHPRLAGDFASGALATLLATPCSAPFLGTAVGFALGAGAKEILGVFTALGLGMAAPYFLVALFPGLATRFPKPGAWMVRLRQAFGVALALSALWLVWVMAAQITVPLAVAFALLMLSVVLFLALRKSGASRLLTTAGLIAVCFSAITMGIGGNAMPKAPPEPDRRWISFDPASLRASLAENKTVFLDVTADWCLTCKANMKFALSDSRVTPRLFHSDIIAMQANWTNPDPAVIELLHKHGRYGIPFNIVFGPQARQGLVLPELLTPSLILEALDKASGNKP